MRILLVEDELDIGKGIKRTLVQEKYIVDWAIDGQVAWQMLNDNSVKYSLAIIDWMLPRLSGLELCQLLRKKGLSLPVLMLTAKDQMKDKIEGLDSGADDYLVKPFKIDELLARLRALSRRSHQYQSPQLQINNYILDYGTHTFSDGKNPEVFLTNKEFQLLEYFMRHPNQILTGEQIRNQLWEFDSESVSNVVAAQIRLLRKKLKFINADHLIETIHNVGYRLQEN
jgi:DNA-binding response OmpR family regulator